MTTLTVSQIKEAFERYKAESDDNTKNYEEFLEASLCEMASTWISPEEVKGIWLLARNSDFNTLDDFINRNKDIN